MILLNPGPANTTETVKAAMTQPDICPRETSFGDLMGKVARQVAQVVSPSDDEKVISVLFGGSGTAAVEAAICSVVPKDGRLLVIDNGAYGSRMKQIAAAYGMSHDSESFGVGGYPDLDRIADKLCRESYSHLAVVHHETTTGMLNPVSEIGALCKKHGVEMIVDAMSSYAGLPIDIEAMGASYLVSSSNKCIQGMAGLGFVIGERAAIEALEPVLGRSLYLNLGEQHRFFKSNNQMRFTPPVQVVYALAQALDEFFEEGQAARHKRYMECFAVLDHGMTELGFKRLLPESMLSKILTAYVEPDHENYSYDELHDRLFSRGFTIYPGKGAKEATFRLANMGAIKPNDMRAFCAAVSQVIDEMGLKPLYAG